VIFGPVFIVLWLALARRKLEPSTPAKMAIGVVFMGLASAVMAMAARSEDRPSSTALAALPPAMVLDAEGRLCEKTAEGGLAPFHAGRLKYDPSRKVLEMAGVLPDTERDRILRETAPAAYQAAVKDLAERSEKWRDGQPPITLVLAEVPPGFDLRYAGFQEKKVRFDAATRTLSAAMILEDKDQKALLVAAADPAFRDALNDLYVRSDAFRVSPWYLILCYLFMTFGELCLSPVGLSMVSKLAPARFATMLMGLWFLTNFFGTFTAGALGEFWGTIPPVPYFLLIVAVLGVAAVAAFLVGRKISALMHGIR
jgi:POT family proton-dependent oligopeptide transporter